MTIPMLPGFWDENKEAIQSLAQTITRSINPYFDNQVALMQGIRQNPGNLQGIIDMSALNPDMFAQTFGPRMLQQLASMGNPSSQVGVEQTARDMVKNQTPLSEVPATVVGDAAVRSLGSRTATDLAKDEKGLARADVELEVLQGNLEQDKFTRNLDNPIYQKNRETTLAAINANPNAAQAMPLDMAERYFRGELNNEQFSSYATAVSEINPVAYDLFNKALAQLSQLARDRKVDERALGRLNAQLDREDRLDRRQAKALAWKAHIETGYPMVEFEKYFMGEPSETIERLWKGRDDMEQARKRIQLVNQLDAPFKAFQKATGKDKEMARAGLEIAMNQIVQGIEIKDLKDGILKRTSKYTFEGKEITGLELAEIFNDPEGWKTKLASIERLKSLSADELRKAIETTQAMNTLGEISQQEFTNEMARLNEALKNRLAEDEKAARAANQRR